VKKSKAVPPAAVAPWLEKYAKKLREEARAAFSHRGSYGNRPATAEMSRLWKSTTRSGSQIYKIDRQNGLVKQLLSRDDLKPELETLLCLLEETVPVQQIWLDMAEHSERSNEPMGGLTEKQVMELAATTIISLAGHGRKPTYETIDYVCRMEAFINYADIIKAKYLGV
jgi:hypothetical protein